MTKGSNIAIKKGDTVSLTYSMREPNEHFKRTVEIRCDDVVQDTVLLTVTKSSATLSAYRLDLLRQLRLWHWRQSRFYRSAQQGYEAHKCSLESAKFRDFLDSDIDNAKSMADMHIGFVQTLNDFFEIGDTAEKDDEK